MSGLVKDLLKSVELGRTDEDKDGAKEVQSETKRLLTRLMLFWICGVVIWILLLQLSIFLSSRFGVGFLVTIGLFIIMLANKDRINDWFNKQFGKKKEISPSVYIVPLPIPI